MTFYPITHCKRSREASPRGNEQSALDNWSPSHHHHHPRHYHHQQVNLKDNEKRAMANWSPSHRHYLGHHHATLKDHKESAMDNRTSSHQWLQIWIVEMHRWALIMLIISHHNAMAKNMWHHFYLYLFIICFCISLIAPIVFHCWRAVTTYAWPRSSHRYRFDIHHPPPFVSQLHLWPLVI